MSEVAKAAERLAKCENCYPNDSDHDEMDDARLVARWAAPLLDETEITRDWLLSIGGVEVESPMGPRYHEHVQFAGSRFQIWEWNGEYWLIDGYDTFELRTQGQFRMLAAVFNIPLKEPAEL